MSSGSLSLFLPLGYKLVDTAKSKCMMAYLKQVVLELPNNENELTEFVEGVCSTKEGKLNIPSGGIWISQARFLAERRW